MPEDSGSGVQPQQNRAFHIVPTDRRGFLRKLIVGSAFGPAVVTSFALGASRALAKSPRPVAQPQGFPNQTHSNQSVFFGPRGLNPFLPGSDKNHLELSPPTSSNPIFPTFPNQTFPNQTFSGPFGPINPFLPGSDKNHLEGSR
jgi:hypothetical protein